ncbi:MAG: M3 family peptidase [Alphaproteobacteria bacterium]|nr:MAG: M3 family peptidase [Alphaproteobacteria bacterium]
MSDPLREEWTGPFGLPDFEAVRDGDFLPAFEDAMRQSRAAIDRIAANPAPPDFANTIAALERAERPLERVSAIFFNLAAADANEERQAIQREIGPRLTAFRYETMLNAPLFARIDALKADPSGLDAEQRRVLTLYHDMFRRAGAMLEGEDRTRLSQIMQRLTSLGTAFTQNLLADERDWSMALAAEDLEGLPGWLTDAMAGAAAERGEAGHVVTLSRSLIVPFLQLSPRRDLRERAFRAWAARGARGGKTDNRDIMAEMLKLREERAHLLGFDSFADFKLEREMAGNPQAVRDLLMAVWEPARARAEADAARLTELMRADSINGALQPWDWRYYAEKLRRAEHDLDEAEIKPYLQLDNIRDAAFETAGRLFDLSFHPVDVPLYHPDCRAWEVRRDGRHLGIFIADMFARRSKRSGAWCSSFRGQDRLDGIRTPIAVNVCNFARPAEGSPALLTLDDARTLFHEFGHALHVLLSDVTYPMISGTSVARDFVELPSQLYEHWLMTPEILSQYARHAETGAPMPPSLRDRVIAAENFDQGFATVEYVASALVDLDFHSGPAPEDPMAAQDATLARIGMPEAIAMRHAAPHFAHVFAGDGYSAGYYSYMWSEVMDADAFEAFRETGDVFDRDTAQRLLRHIYSAGGSREASDLYLAFRGRMPGVEALLKGRGLVPEAA